MLAAALKSLRAMPLDEALAALGHCGLQGVEVEAQTLLESCAAFEDFTRRGLQVMTVDATSLDPASDAWLDRLSTALEAAQRVAAPILIANAGERLSDRHRRAADLAASHDITLAFDTLPGLCGDTREMARTLEDLQHSAIRLNLDTGRYLQQNPWSSAEVALQRVFGQVASVRLTNFTVGVEPQEFPPLGQGGDIDCARILQIVRGLNFTGPVTIAFEPTTRRPPTGEQCRQWLIQSVEHLRSCGWLK